MEKDYDDFKILNNYESIAKAYSQKLKENDFVFINLKQEQFNFDIDEILITIKKIKACLNNLSKTCDSSDLSHCLTEAEQNLCQKYKKNATHINYKCILHNNFSLFMCLISLENQLLSTLFKSISNPKINPDFYQIFEALVNIFSNLTDTISVFQEKPNS